MIRNLKRVASFALLMASAGCGGQVTSLATKDFGLFSSEEQPALEDSLNRPAPASIGKVSRGATVKILGDTYGKDDWACHVQMDKKVGYFVIRLITSERLAPDNSFKSNPLRDGL